MKQPETVQKMAELGAIAVAKDPQEFSTYITSETMRWKSVIEKAAIKVD